MEPGVGTRILRVTMVVVTTVSLTIVACTAPVTPPPGGQGPEFLINSPSDGGFTAGTFFFSVQPLDTSAIARVDFEVDGVDVGSDDTAADGFRIAVSARDHDAGQIVLRATVTGKNGRTRTESVTVENVPNPPSSTTVGADGAVLGTSRGSTLGIRPGDAVGADVTFTERTQAEVKAATGVDYAALGVTFLGAQEIDSDRVIEQPTMVSSADFAAFVQEGQAVVNYRIAPDLDGDGIGELVVVNTASVAGSDVISDPVPTLQLGDAVVTGQRGSSRFSTHQETLTVAPGDLVEFEASGFNPISAQSNLVLWNSLVDGTVAGGFALASGEEPQIVGFVVPVLPAGPATVTLVGVSNGGSVGPIDVTIEPIGPLVGTPEQVIDDFLTAAAVFVQGLLVEEGSFEAKLALLQQLTELRGAFALLFDDLASDPDPEIEAALEDIALLFSAISLPSLVTDGIWTQALTDDQKVTIKVIGAAAAAGLTGFTLAAKFGAEVTCIGAAITPIPCGVFLGLTAVGVIASTLLLRDEFQDRDPGCPASTGGPADEAPRTTGMGSAPPSGGSGCGAAVGGSGSLPGVRTQQAGTDSVVVKIFVGGDPLPFSGVVDAGGYFFIPLIPAGEPFLAVATDTATAETRIVEGIGPAVGESVFMFFDFISDGDTLPTLPLDGNVSGDIAPGESLLYSFVGSAGRLVTVGSQGDPDFDGLYSVELFDPDSNRIVDLGPSEFYRESDVVALPASGPYTLSVRSDSGTGTFQIGLSEIIDPVLLDISSSPATVSGEQTVYGDRHHYRFAATAGDLHKFSLTLPPGSEFNAALHLYGPAAEPFYERPDLISPTVSVTGLTSTGALAVSDPFVVPETGEYIVEIERGNSSSLLPTSLGAWEFAVHTPDPATAIAVGDPVTASIGVPGEIDLFTFTATAGQKVDFSTDNLAAEVDQVNWSVTAPDGSVIFDEPLFADPGTFTLAQAGSYTVMVGSDADEGSGDYEFTLVDVP